VVDPVATGVVDPLATRVVEPLATGTVEPLATGVVDPVATGVVDPVATGVVEPVANAVGGVTGAVEPVAAATEPVTAVVEPTSRAVESLPGVGESVAGPLEQIAAVEPLTETAPPVPALPEPATAAGEGDGGPFWTFPFDVLPGAAGGTEEILILSALAAAGATAVKARFFLANTPPIPLACVVGEASRYMSALTSGTTSLSTGARVGAGRVVESAVEKAESTVEELAQVVRDGFLRGAGRLDEPDDQASDTRLLMQIGMVLGTVYLGFLTVWFWATRLRWSPGN
jgi:hypothetical protein